MTQPSVVFDQVTKKFGKNVLALNAATFSVQPGTRTCLLGPNGAGKSTTIELLQAAMRPTSGTLTLLGQKVGSRAYYEARRRVGIVPQRPGMYHDLKVVEYFKLAMQLSQSPKARLDELIESFELGPHLDKVLSSLSGGYQRRVVLAAALVGQPELLLLDEPTVGMDPLASENMREVLRTTMEGRTTLFCTHDLLEAEYLCDSVIVLNEGQVRLESSIAALQARKGVRTRMAAVGPREDLLKTLRHKGVRAEAALADDDVYVYIDPKIEAPKLVEALTQTGLVIYLVQPAPWRLGEIFKEAVQGTLKGVPASKEKTNVETVKSI